MERPARISVIIPTHDTRDLTIACVESVLTVTDPEVDVTVVDDWSTDGTAEALEERFDIEVIRLEELGGFTVAANMGLARARGDILLLLNSDTEVDSSAFEAVRRAMDGDPRLGIAGARLTYPDGRPQWSGGVEPTLWWLFVLASGLTGLLEQIPGYRRLRPVSGSLGGDVAWVPGAAMAIRREVWDKLGPLDESFRFYCQDLEFCLRAREAGWTVQIPADCHATHHLGATIDRDRGAVVQQHLEVLWLDLIQWVRMRRGTTSALRAARALQLGGYLRIACRRAWGLLLPPRQRRDWEEETLRYRRALAALLRVPELTDGLPGVF